MNKSFNKAILITFIFTLILFVMTISLYYVSLFLGYKGLAIPILGGGDDGVFYYKNALIIKNGGNAILTSVHVTILGYVLKILDTEYLFYLKLFNFLGIIFFVIIHYYLIKAVATKKDLYNVYSLFLILVLFYISFIYISSISILRDVWIVNFFSLSCYFFIKLLQARVEFKIFYLVPLIISCIILFSYRDYALLSFLGGTAIFLFFNRKNYHSNTLLIVIGVMVVFGVYYTLFKDYKLPIVDMSLMDGLKYRKDGQEIYFGGSQMNIVLDQPNYISFLINYLYSLLSNGIGPLPNQISGFGTLVIFFAETIPMIFILYYIFKKRKLLSYYDKYLFIQVFTWLLFIGITNDNLGTASRLRTVSYIIILVIFSTLVYKNKNQEVEDE